MTELPTRLLPLLDAVLKNHAGFFDALAHDPAAYLQVLLLTTAITFLSGAYGLAMGLPGGLRQAVSSALKVPALFLCSLLICFPALYVITVLIGSRFSVSQMR